MCVRPLITALVLASVVLGPVGTAAAQTETPAAEAEAPAAEETAAVLPSDAPYMRPMGRLAAILGSMHFLRRLCGDAEADLWRVKMQELIVAQAPNEADRRRLVASFNSGYRAFESTYRHCTPAAQVAVSRYQSEGAALAREIGVRYGN
ncbi:MAG: TIGR02301 family protein [Aurantimonas endophytica]|jgi:uncharacterized protein (TIGR02301 family)|uniref:Uncharacterized protein (TIGR02301 family) n=1 Tax=Aurantimonas endophytica TaxID=1522175 RepID=A0A7W6MQR5_9HYPH|nr:TIGR02301 family protein [Aurantimonas endophytica]MBB4004305.1 uncharacterized protein (TIGR02301 family) [Aurantimonas endophytica]MCO6405145.1 TIGR02301 family protein [Aurantimonas endophytica]